MGVIMIIVPCLYAPQSGAFFEIDDRPLCISTIMRCPFVRDP